MDLIIYLLSCAGATLILVYGRIFAWLRNPIERRGWKHRLPFHCSMCMGFWVGVAIYWTFAGIGWSLPGPVGAISSIIYGFASSLVSYVFGSLVGDGGLRITTTRT